MFVQVVQGNVRDAEAARRHLERWRDDVCPGAVGLLDATAGVTDDGWLVHVARFRSQGDAGANSARPEQTAWWEGLDQLLEGPLSFHDCNDVALVVERGEDRAGFVQVIQTHDPGRQRLPQVAATLAPVLEQHRPDIVGGVLARAEDGTITQVVYFTSEEDAREHEAKGVPDEDAKVLRALWGDPDAQVRFYDLRAPLLFAP